MYVAITESSQHIFYFTMTSVCVTEAYAKHLKDELKTEIAGAIADNLGVAGRHVLEHFSVLVLQQFKDFEKRKNELQEEIGDLLSLRQQVEMLTAQAAAHQTQLVTIQHREAALVAEAAALQAQLETMQRDMEAALAAQAAAHQAQLETMQHREAALAAQAAAPLVTMHEPPVAPEPPSKRLKNQEVFYVDSDDDPEEPPLR
jgi:DNA repair exonuclease SbcCD ATPase subunit